MERKVEIERFSLPVEGVTDAEIANAIRYLDPEYANDERSGDPTDAVLVISSLIGSLWCILLSWRAA